MAIVVKITQIQEKKVHKYYARTLYLQLNILIVSSLKVTGKNKKTNSDHQNPATPIGMKKKSSGLYTTLFC
jgi:hypothetical protein